MDRNDWNRRYADAERVGSVEPNRFVVEALAALEPAGGARALDVGAGEGRNALWLAGRGFRVTAVDFSEVAIERGRAEAEARGLNVDWVVRDVRGWSPEAGAYGVVLVSYLQLPWDQMQPVIARAAAAVGPRGTFLLVAHDRSNATEGWGGPKDPEVTYTARQVERELDGLEMLSAGTRERPVETEAGVRTAIDCVVRAVRP